MSVMLMRRNPVLPAWAFGLVLVLAGALAGCGTEAPSSSGGGATPASPASGAASFVDPVGDLDGGDGPDITAVAVTGDDQAVTFTVTFASTPPLAADVEAGYTDMIMIPVDTEPAGGSFVIGGHAVTMPEHVLVRRCPAGLSACNGPAGQVDLVEVGPAVIEGSTVAITVDRDVLGDPAGLAFSVAAGREGEAVGDSGGDTAPDTGTWSWTLP